MLQFNLLPGVKIEYVKAQRVQRLVIGISMLTMAAAVTITLLLFLIVYGVQKKNTNDLSTDIKKYSGQLKDTPDINKILTVQNQMAALGGLHDQKTVASRVFDVAQQTTPRGVSISDFTTDFAANTMTITGSTSSLDNVNTYVDSLKYATFKSDDDTTSKPFTAVVLSAFGRGEASTTFSVTLNFDPAIFSSSTAYNLSVPNQTTTNSVTSQPSQIFNQSATTPATAGGGSAAR